MTQTEKSNNPYETDIQRMGCGCLSVPLFLALPGIIQEQIFSAQQSPVHIAFPNLSVDKSTELDDDHQLSVNKSLLKINRAMQRDDKAKAILALGVSVFTIFPELTSRIIFIADKMPEITPAVGLVVACVYGTSHYMLKNNENKLKNNK